MNSAIYQLQAILDLDDPGNTMLKGHLTSAYKELVGSYIDQWDARFQLTSAA